MTPIDLAKEEYATRSTIRKNNFKFTYVGISSSPRIPGLPSPYITILTMEWNILKIFDAVTLIRLDFYINHILGIKKRKYMR